MTPLKPEFNSTTSSTSSTGGGSTSIPTTSGNFSKPHRSKSSRSKDIRKDNTLTRVHLKKLLKQIKKQPLVMLLEWILPSIYYLQRKRIPGSLKKRVRLISNSIKNPQLIGEKVCLYSKQWVPRSDPRI